MKKICLMLALMLAMATNMMAQSVDDIFKEFRDMPNVDFVNLPKAMIGAITAKTGKDKLKDVEMLRALNIENNKDLQDKFAKKVQGISKKGYEEMVNSNEENEKTQILVKTDGEVLTEILIIHLATDESGIVQICGKIRPEDLNDLDLEKLGK
ncbi:MAG: DUF4252 domain-containing protein [Prevotella sp.]|nr:DUF4252 domain-containing protein [Prevotella sp.]